MKNYFAECIGTFWLVFGGCGAAIISAGFPESGIGFLGVSLAFGLTVLTMIYAVGHISGAHFNPAVTIGLYAGGVFDKKQVIPYIVSQLTGAIIAAGILYFIATGKSDFELGSFAANGYGVHSPGEYDLTSAFLTELILTCAFLFIILGSTHRKAPKGFAGIAIGLSLTLIHLISIPVTNTSVNPARSTSQAIFAGEWAIGQLWLFWLAPIIGAVIAGLIYRQMYNNEN